MSRPVLPICLVLFLTNLVFAQSPDVLTIARNDSTIVITNFGLSSQGKRTLVGLECEEGTRVTYFYGPPGDVEVLIDAETRLRSSLVIITVPEGAGTGEGRETIEVLDGVAAFAEGRPCITSVKSAEMPRVVLEQGRTTIVGTRFFLDRETDVAEMAGPIDLTRAPEGGSSPLDAGADSLKYRLASKSTLLEGQVRVIAGDRVTEAESLELDETASIALLVGQPVVSREGDNEIRSNSLLYYLDSNDVVAEGDVRSVLEIGLE